MRGLNPALKQRNMWCMEAQVIRCKAEKGDVRAWSARLVLEVLDVGVQRAQLVALALARLALLAQLRLLLAQRRLLLPDQRALLAHLLPRLQHAHLQLRALALGGLTHHKVVSYGHQKLPGTLDVATRLPLD